MITLCIGRTLSRRSLPLILIMAICVGGAVSSCGSDGQSASRVARVKTAVAVSAAGDATLSYPGRVEAHKEVGASFRVAGPIVRVAVKQGDYVQKGQLLAELDARDYQVQLSATEAEYAQAEAEAARIEALYAEQATTASVYDQARYGLAQLAEKLANCRNQLADTRLLAPISGYVRSLLHEAGETVGAGTPVVSLAGDGALEVEISVPSAQLGQIEGLIGATAHKDNQEWALRLVSVSQTGGASGRYPVRLAFVENPEGVAVGMAVQVFLSLPSARSSEEETSTEADAACVAIPLSAVVREGETCYVWVVKDGIARRQTVQPSAILPDGSMTVAGIEAGTVVVAAGVHSLEDGQAVEVMEEVSKTNEGGLM